MSGEKQQLAGLSHTARAMAGLRWIGTARLLSQVVTWSLTAITVRLLRPADYGIVATAGLFTILASLLLDGGLSAVLISRSELSEGVKGAAVTGVLLVAFTLGTLIEAAAPLGGEFFKTPALVTVLRVAALQLPLTALCVVPLANLSRNMEFRTIALVQSGCSVVQGVTTLLMAYFGWGYWALIGGTLVGSSTRSVLLWSVVEPKPLPTWNLAPLRPLVENSMQMVGQRVLYFVSTEFDTFLLSRLGGPAILGPYALARTLSHTALDQLSSSVSQVTLPVLAAKGGDRIAQTSALGAVISSASTLVFPLFWLLGVLSPVALPLVFGERWAALVFPFTAFCLVLPLRAIYTLLDAAVIGTGSTSTTLKNMMVWAAVMMPLIYVGAHFGANATALAWVLGIPIVFVSAIRRVACRFHCDIARFFRPLLLPALCAAASCACVELVLILLRGYQLPLISIAAGGGGGVACYVALMRRFARPSYDQIMHLLMLFVGRRPSP